MLYTYNQILRLLVVLISTNRAQTIVECAYLTITLKKKSHHNQIGDPPPKSDLPDLEDPQKLIESPECCRMDSNHPRREKMGLGHRQLEDQRCAEKYLG